uniref:Transmembrane protein 163b n=1 Tax=Oryzias sinensis TaxID=183150 RepID=A0A8C7YU95_9TELE
MTEPPPNRTAAAVEPALVNGQSEPTQPQEEQRKAEAESPGEGFKMDQEMKITDSIEDRGLLESSVRLKPHEAQSFRKKALWVSWASIVATIILAVAAFSESHVTQSLVGSDIVRWRNNNVSCVILGVVFILSSLCILGKAIHDLATKLLPEVDDFLFSVSIVSGLVCVILAVIKFMLGKVLTSRVLVTDGFNSLVGGVMGFSILISAEVFKHEPKVWYLDGTIGVLMGLIILAYGVKLLLDMIPRVRQTRNYERFE